MTTILFENNAKTTIASGINSSVTSVTLAAGAGATFPHPGAGEYFVGTFKDASTKLVTEIVQCTAVVGDVVTIVRAQEGTTAKSWAAGDLFANLWTAGSAAQMLQQGEAQEQGGNYAEDTGTVNAYVVALDPPTTVDVIGMPVRVYINHASTGPSTLDVGGGPQGIIHPGTGLLPIAAGDLALHSVYTFIWDGNHYQVQSNPQMTGDSGGGGTQGVVPAPPLGSAALGKMLLASGAFGLADLSLQTNTAESFGSSGHVKLGNLIVQWGQVSCAADGGTASVTWPIAFPTACNFAICSQNTDTTGSIERSGCAIWGTSTTGATVNNNWDSTSTIGYLAIGH